MKPSPLYLAALLSLTASAHGQVIIADDYNVANAGTGFGLNAGVNAGINPPATRLTGSTAADMRYLLTATGKASTTYSITGNQLQVAAGAGSGRFTLSTDGATPFDFGTALGIGSATPSAPVVYEVSISMANNTTGTQRFSFALGTAENNANFWDFGIQLYRANTANDFYQIGKRIDVVSYTTATDSTGTGGDINASITSTGAGTYGSQLDFLMRVTDAGAEASTFNSRVQLSLDGGGNWFYDTQSDAALPDGFRFDGVERFFMWDIAGGAVATYDNFSVIVVPEPSTTALALLGGLVLIRLKKSRKASRC